MGQMETQIDHFHGVLSDIHRPRGAKGVGVNLNFSGGIREGFWEDA